MGGGGGWGGFVGTLVRRAAAGPGARPKEGPPPARGGLARGRELRGGGEPLQLEGGHILACGARLEPLLRAESTAFLDALGWQPRR